MSLYGGLRQHTVEFIRGVGVRTDGVLVSSVATSFNWSVPAGVAQVFISGTGGGGGGGSGYNTGTARSGGGGGGSGTYVIGLPFYVYPKSTLTIAPGQGGTGGTIGVDNAANGTVTSITGLPTAHPWTLATGAAAAQFTLGYGQRGRGFNATAGASSGSGGTNFNSTTSISGGVLSTGGPNGLGTPAVNGGGIVAQTTSDFGGATLGGCAGGAGGAASTTTPNPPVGAAGTAPGNLPNLSVFVYVPGGIGGTDNTNSYGGGGTGGHTPWGFGGQGGGDITGTAQNGGAGAGYGTGGGGGGGSGAGGNGANGYVMIVYFSYE